ncbi:MAG: aminotransferase class III-fold pyridoxal phosphate-dependent enzyme [Desulfobacterales bacterium]|nr:aminotransferase class III-fold pyridoxal phosphate-dependent enzyme [Desulfobacterales bacterium]
MKKNDNIETSCLRNPDVDPALIKRSREIIDRELETFRKRTPRSAQWLAEAEHAMPGGVPMAWMRSLYRHAPVVAVRGSGSQFVDLDGNSYLDFNACDLSMPAGFAPEPIVRAIQNQALLGNSFLLPTTDSLEVCKLLSARFGLPQWQFTLSASGANADALRIARVATGRSTILTFDGKYHGHLDQTLWERNEQGGMDAELTGLDPTSAQGTDVIPYNDPAALRERLARGDVAAVLIESALTNCGLVLPTPEFVESLNTDVRSAGAVLIVDETHVQFAVHGGGTTVFNIEPDILTGGKGIAGGVPIGVYGMTDRIATVLNENRDHDPGLLDINDAHGIAVGGTLYANALSLAAARVGLSEIFTPEAGKRVDFLGQKMQIGLQQQVDRVGLPWTIDRLGGRIQWRITPEKPRNGAESIASLVLSIADARKVFLINRGIWDSIAQAGPSVSYAMDEAGVDTYIALAGDFLDDLTR